MALIAIHPGEHLAEELKALNMSAAALVRQLTAAGCGASSGATVDVEREAMGSALLLGGLCIARRVEMRRPAVSESFSWVDWRCRAIFGPIQRIGICLKLLVALPARPGACSRL